MRKFIMLGILFLIPGCVFAYDTRVNGYYKQNGTYVQPYVRTAPNHTSYDNYSTAGNYNPYTGQQGTKPANDYGYSSNNSFNSYGNSSYKKYGF